MPAGASLVTLAPVAHIPAWSRAASLLGIALLAGAILPVRRRARRQSVTGTS